MQSRLDSLSKENCAVANRASTGRRVSNPLALLPQLGQPEPRADGDEMKADA